MKNFPRKLFILMLTAVMGLFLIIPVKASAATAQTPDATLYGYSLSLYDSGRIGLNLYVKVSDDYAGTLSVVTGTETVSLDSAHLMSTDDNVCTYKVSIPVKATDMATAVKSTVFYNDEELFSTSTSVKDCAEVYASDEYYGVMTQNLAKALLNYGAGAQVYFDKNTDSLANAGLSEEDKVVTSSDYSSQKYVKIGAVSGVTYYGTSLILKEDFTIRHYFSMDDASKITFVVNGNSLEANRVSDGESGLYYVDITGIGVGDVDNSYTLIISDDEENASLTYGIKSYAAAVKDTDLQLLSLVNSISAYSLAYKNYVSSLEMQIGNPSDNTGSEQVIELELNDSDDTAASCTRTSVTYMGGRGFTSELPDPSREGYSFEGWYTEADGGNKITADATAVPVSKLYAHWGNVVIVCETAVVIEPNESYTSKSSLSLDCMTIASDDSLDSGYTYSILKNKNDASSSALSSAECGLNIEADSSDGKLNLYAGSDISTNSSGCLYIKLETNEKDAFGNALDTKYITVYVRKVVSASITKEIATSTTTRTTAESVHVLTGNLTIYNANKYNSLVCDSDYADTDMAVDDVIWTVSCKGINDNPITYYIESAQLSDNTNILSQLISTDGYKGKAGDKITIKLANDLPKGETITLTMTPVHNQGTVTYGGTVYTTNKASLAKYNDGQATAKAYSCSPAVYTISADGLFGEITDYRRGTELGGGLGSDNCDEIFNDLFKNTYDKYSAMYEANPDEVDKYGNSYKDVCDWLENFRNNNINYTVGYFYRIKDYKYDDNGNLESAVGWSQYRIMGEGSYFTFRKVSNPSLSTAEDLGDGTMGGTLSGGMSNRLAADVYQSVEFVAVIYDESSHTILWPYYEELMDYGFGDYSKHCGVDYSFSEVAQSITGDYLSYATTFDVEPARIEYEANTTLNTPAGDTIGSTNDPVILGDDVSSESINGRLKGINVEEYGNNLSSGILMKNDGTGWSEVTIFGHGEGLPSVVSNCSGGIEFSIGSTDLSFVFDTSYSENVTDTTSVYRVVPVLYSFKLGYIKDEDQVFSDKIYWDTDHVYNYILSDDEEDADSVSGSITVKRYGIAEDITLDLNDGGDTSTVCDSSSVEFMSKKGFTEDLPEPTRDNYIFEGWYTESEGGTKVTKDTTSLTSDTLYAHWVDSQYTMELTSTSSSQRWISSSGGVATSACDCIDETYTLTNYGESGTYTVKFVMKDDSTWGNYGTGLISNTSTNDWTWTGTLGQNDSTTITISYIAGDDCGVKEVIVTPPGT